MAQIKPNVQLELDVTETFIKNIGNTVDIPGWLSQDNSSKTLKILAAGRPTTNPKTDVYVGLGTDSGITDYLGISIKKDDANWVENWTNTDTFENFFGKEASQKIIEECWAQQPEDKKYAGACSFHHSGKLNNTGLGIGWAFQIGFLPPSGSSRANTLSGDLDDISIFNNVREHAIHEAYSGELKYTGKIIKLDNGTSTPDNLDIGIANCMLHAAIGSFSSPQDIVNMLTPIPCSEGSPTNNEDEKLYYTFKKVNHYSGHPHDTSSPLTVKITWRITGNTPGNIKLAPYFEIGTPVICRVGDSMHDLQRQLDELPEGYRTTMELAEKETEIF